MNESVLVGICVVTWNGGQTAARCLRSILAQDYRDCRVVVVDNGSTPDERTTLGALVRSHAHIEVIWNPQNAGFAAAANQGLRHALACGAHWLLLVTQDVVLAPDTCSRLVTVAGSIPGLAIAGPVVFDSETGRVLSAGERVAPWLLAVPRTIVRRRWTQRPYTLVSGLVGCCLLLSPVVLTDLGGFCEDLFAYYEEVDLCLRARAKGYKLAVVPEAVVLHNGWRGYATGFTPRSAELKARNLILLARKHVPPWQWLWVGPSLLFLIGASLLSYLVRGNLPVVAALGRGTFAGLIGSSGPPRSS